MEEKVVECLQMKEVFLIGNRLSCYKILANNSNYSIRHIWAKTNSLLDTFLNEKEISHNRFDIQDKQHVMMSIYLTCNIFKTTGKDFIKYTSNISTSFERCYTIKWGVL